MSTSRAINSISRCDASRLASISCLILHRPSQQAIGRNATDKFHNVHTRANELANVLLTNLLDLFFFLVWIITAIVSLSSFRQCCVIPVSFYCSHCIRKTLVSNRSKKLSRSYSKLAPKFVKYKILLTFLLFSDMLINSTTASIVLFINRGAIQTQVSLFGTTIDEKSCFRYIISLRSIWSRFFSFFLPSWLKTISGSWSVHQVLFHNDSVMHLSSISTNCEKPIYMWQFWTAKYTFGEQTFNGWAAQNNLQKTISTLEEWWLAAATEALECQKTASFEISFLETI